MGQYATLILSGGLRHACNPEEPGGRFESSILCWEKSDGNSQGPSLAIAARRSHLSKPYGAPYDRRNAGANCCHPPSNQSLAEGMGAQSRQRATAPSERSKKRLRLRDSSSTLCP